MPRIRTFLSKAWLPLLIVLIALAARIITGPRTVDDAYITFRYAQNILDGSGFVYNPGERVLGTTTPLYTLLMTFLGLFSGGGAPFEWLSLGVNALADALTCLLLIRLGRRLGAPMSGIFAALAWAVAPFSVTFAIGGMETSVVICLLTAAVAFHADEKHLSAALCGILALLTRPDAVLLIGLLFLARVWQAWRGKERFPWREAAAFFLPGLAWLTFSTLYFGSPLPHSVPAKSAAYHLERTEALVRLLQHYATPFHQDQFLGRWGIGLGLLLFITLYIAGAVLYWKRAPRLRAWLVYPALYLAVYAAANPLIFRWYLSPPLPALFLSIFAALEYIIGYAQHKKDALMPAWRRIALPLILALPLLSLLNAWALRPDHAAARPAPQMAYIQLELLYKEAAAWLKPQMNSDDVLAAGDVGVLGYETRAVILDTVGLVSPQSVAYYPLPDEDYVINYAISGDLILDQQPDWLVTLEVYGRETLLKDERFLAQYRLVHSISTDMYGSEGLLIFHRVGGGDG